MLMTPRISPRRRRHRTSARRGGRPARLEWLEPRRLLSVVTFTPEPAAPAAVMRPLAYHTASSIGAAAVLPTGALTVTATGIGVAGMPHTAIATVWIDDGTGTDTDGEMGFFDRVAGAKLTFVYTNADGAVAAPAGPVQALTGADGTARTVLTSNTPGQITIDVSGSFLAGATTVQLATDGTGASSLPFVLTFAPNIAPVATADDGVGFTTDEDTAFTTGDVLANDTDPNPGSTLTIQDVDTTGMLGLLADNGDGTFDYDPNGRFEALAIGDQATDTFHYTVHDDLGAPDTAAVTILVLGANDVPTAVDDGSGDDRGAFTTDAQSPFTTPDVLANDTDPDAGAQLSLLSIDTTATLGLVTDNGDGTFHYDPDGRFAALGAGDEATDTFIYRLQDDQGATDAATVTVTVTGLDDALVAADDGGPGFETDEDSAFTTASVLANDTDPDAAAPLSVVDVDTTGTIGLVVDNGDGTFDYDPNGQFEQLAVGTQATDTFTYTVAADGDVETATVTITIDGVNDAPTAADDGAGDDSGAFTTDADSAFTTPDVLANDTDPDAGALLSVLSVDTLATLGLVTDNGDGTFHYDPDGRFAALGAGEEATDTFIYRLQDDQGATDTATVTVTVTGLDDALVAADDGGPGFETDEDSAFTTASVLANDTDPDAAAPLSVVDVDTTGTIGLVVDNGDGTFDYDPNGQFEQLAVGTQATDTFTYTVAADGNVETATVTITIDGVNDAPLVGGEPYTIGEDGTLVVPVANGVLANDQDPDDDPLEAALVVGPSLGSLSLEPDGSFTYTPDADRNGTDTFTYDVSDGQGGITTAVASLSVVAANDAPFVADAIDDVTVPLDAPPVQIDLTTVFDDVDIDTNADALALTVVANTNEGLVATDIADGMLTLTFTAAQLGSAVISVRATDTAGASVDDTFTVIVAAPDLVIVDFVVPPVALAPGGPAPFTFSIRNDGGIPVAGFDIQLFITNTLAPDVFTVFDGPDLHLLPGVTLVPTDLDPIPLGDPITFDQSLAPGATATFTADVRAPARLDLFGPFTVFGSLDEADALVEVDETNNSFAADVFSDELIPLETRGRTRRLRFVNEAGNRMQLRLMRVTDAHMVQRRYSGDTPDIRRVTFAGGTVRSRLVVTGAGSIGAIEGGLLGTITTRRDMALRGDIDLTALQRLRIGDIGAGVAVHVALPAARGMRVQAERIGADVDFDLPGRVRDFRALQYDGGTLNADVLDRFQLRGHRRRQLTGDLGAQIHVSGNGATRYAAGTVRVRGSLIDALIQVDGPLGVRMFGVDGALVNSQVRIDVTDGIERPSSADDFDSRRAAIGNLRIKGLLTASNVFAPVMNRVRLGPVTPDNQGSDFGLVTLEVRSATRAGVGRLTVPVGAGTIDREGDFVFEIG